MRLYKLDDKVICVKGNAAQFLNGITSNTLEAPLNAFLNQHGRIIATFRQRKISDEEHWISVPDVVIENLLKHLERYAKLAHVRLEPNDQASFIDLDTAQTVWDSAVHANSATKEAFILFRLDNHIPLMGIDYQVDEFILNVHENNYVSYTKGCFLGQEPVAKVHNRSVPSRKLVVAYEDECLPEIAAKITSKAIDPVTKRAKGFVFINNKTS